MADNLTLRRGVPHHNEVLDVLTLLGKEQYCTPTQVCINLLTQSIQYKVAAKKLKRRKKN